MADDGIGGFASAAIITYILLSITSIQVLSSWLTLFVTQLELERSGRDDLLEGLQEGVVVLEGESHEVVYYNAATCNGSFNIGQGDSRGPSMIEMVKNKSQK